MLLSWAGIVKGLKKVLQAVGILKDAGLLKEGHKANIPPRDNRLP
jgi:hypothetical protein